MFAYVSPFLSACLIAASFGCGSAQAQTAEEWMAQFGSFETGNFAASGSETELSRDYSPAAPMDGWTMSSGVGLGDFASTPPGAWVQDSIAAQSGSRYLRLETNLHYLPDAPPDVNSTHFSSAGLQMNFGTSSGGYIEPGKPYAPALTPNQTYQISFWVRDFGSNSTDPSLTVFFFDQTSSTPSHSLSHVPSPFRELDSDGIPIPYDPEDPSAQWVQHFFTFESTEGNGTLGISLNHSFPWSENHSSQTIYLDNFQLTAIPAPVPEPAGSLLIGLSLIALFGRRSRPSWSVAILASC